MNAPDNLKYTKDHEWIKIEGNTATIGVTDYAQEQLGDIVYAELPEEGETVSKDGTFGVLESVKAVSDCYSPLSGKVLEVNTVLTENPETVNQDPYDDGWMIKVEIANSAELDGLMDNIAYKAFVAEEKA